MTFPFKFSHSFSNTSNTSYGRNPLDGRTLASAFIPRQQAAAPHAGTLSQAELQRIVAEMVG